MGHVLFAFLMAGVVLFLWIRSGEGNSVFMQTCFLLNILMAIALLGAENNSKLNDLAQVAEQQQSRTFGEDIARSFVIKAESNNEG